MPIPNPTNLLTLAVLAYCVDSQDGSMRVTLYNSREDLAKELKEEEADFTVDDIESGDDPYEYGTLSEVTIDLELDPGTGNFKLARPRTFSTDG